MANGPCVTVNNNMIGLLASVRPDEEPSNPSPHTHTARDRSHKEGQIRGIAIKPLSRDDLVAYRNEEHGGRGIYHHQIKPIYLVTLAPILSLPSKPPFPKQGLIVHQSHDPP